MEHRTGLFHPQGSQPGPWSPACGKPWLLCQEEIVQKLQGNREGNERLEKDAFPLVVPYGMQVMMENCIIATQ